MEAGGEGEGEGEEEEEEAIHLHLSPDQTNQDLQKVQIMLKNQHQISSVLELTTNRITTMLKASQT